MGNLPPKEPCSVPPANQGRVYAVEWDGSGNLGVNRVPEAGRGEGTGGEWDASVVKLLLDWWRREVDPTEADIAAHNLGDRYRLFGSFRRSDARGRCVLLVCLQHVASGAAMLGVVAPEDSANQQGCTVEGVLAFFAGTAPVLQGAKAGVKRPIGDIQAPRPTEAARIWYPGMNDYDKQSLLRSLRERLETNYPNADPPDLSSALELLKSVSAKHLYKAAMLAGDLHVEDEVSVFLMQGMTVVQRAEEWTGNKIDLVRTIVIRGLVVPHTIPCHMVLKLILHTPLLRLQLLWILLQENVETLLNHAMDFQRARPPGSLTEHTFVDVSGVTRSCWILFSKGQWEQWAGETVSFESAMYPELVTKTTFKDYIRRRVAFEWGVELVPEMTMQRPPIVPRHITTMPLTPEDFGPQGGLEHLSLESLVRNRLVPPSLVPSDVLMRVLDHRTLQALHITIDTLRAALCNDVNAQKAIHQATQNSSGGYYWTQGWDTVRGSAPMRAHAMWLMRQDIQGLLSFPKGSVADPKTMEALHGIWTRVTDPDDPWHAALRAHLAQDDFEGCEDAPLLRRMATWERTRSPDLQSQPAPPAGDPTMAYDPLKGTKST